MNTQRSSVATPYIEGLMTLVNPLGSTRPATLRRSPTIFLRPKGAGSIGLTLVRSFRCQTSGAHDASR